MYSLAAGRGAGGASRGWSGAIQLLQPAARLLLAYPAPLNCPHDDLDEGNYKLLTPSRKTGSDPPHVSNAHFPHLGADSGKSLETHRELGVTLTRRVE